MQKNAAKLKSTAHLPQTGELILHMEAAIGDFSCYLNQQETERLGYFILKILPNWSIIPRESDAIAAISQLSESLNDILGILEKNNIHLPVRTVTKARMACDRANMIAAIANPEAHAACLELVAAEEAYKQAKQRVAQVLS